MANKKIIKETVIEQVVEILPVKPIKVKKIKKLGVDIPAVIIEPVIIKDLHIKPKRVLSPEQLEKMRLGRIKSLEAKKASK
jgi:hypothetical protein